MKKLNLDVEQLAVESFEVDAGGGRGTVMGHHVPTHTCDMQCYDTVRTCNQYQLTCMLWDTCLESACAYATCDYTCHSCPPTCVHENTCGLSCDNCTTTGTGPDIQNP